MSEEIERLDALCGNCGRAYKSHYLEQDDLYCNNFTNGDFWMDVPTQDYISNELFLRASDEQVQEIIQEWKAKNGHISLE